MFVYKLMTEKFPRLNKSLLKNRGDLISNGKYLVAKLKSLKEDKENQLRELLVSSMEGI
ncbi:MAG: hypothetical protein QMD14_00725 [Candidatus Aenigmarchaeota archaeon]|nr:hypothetical protein [Candidatus Aenigmarchaeota archaeon]